MTIELIKRAARPLSSEERNSLRDLPLRPAVDYSSFVTLVRDQDVTSSCAIQTIAALVDILKERERKYTPDVSEGFIGYAYQVSIGYYPKDPRIQIPADGQAGVVEHLGAASEAALSSRNYDPAQLGQTPAPAEIPCDEAIRAARALTIKDHRVRTFANGDGLRPLKALLAAGLVGVLYAGHCMALIGYDDAKAEFTFQNSYGEIGPNRGFARWSYRDMETRLPDITVTVVDNAPAPPTAYPYVARLHVRTPGGRDKLRIRLGVEGQAPSTVWAPAPYGAHDGGQALLIDVPLPDYAAAHWPPSDRNPWYVEFANPGQPNGEIEEVALVKRSFTAGGASLPTVFRASTTKIPLASTRPEQVFIPARTSTVLSLSVNHRSVSAGQNVVFSATLHKKVAASSTKAVILPMANQELDLRLVKPDSIEQTVEQARVARAPTDAKGKCTIVYTPRATGQYQASAAMPDGTRIATSNPVRVEVR